MQHIKKKHIRLATLLIVASLLVVVSAVIAALLLRALRGEESPLSLAPPPKNYAVEYPTFDDEKLDKLIGAYVKKEVDSFVKRAGSDTDQASRMALNYQPIHIGERTASYIFSKKVLYPDKPEKEVKRYVTLDLVKKKHLSLKSIVKDNGESREVLAWLLYDFFAHNTDAGLTPVQLTALYDFSIGDVRQFWLTEDFLVIEMNLHDLKNKEAETRTVAVKKELIAPALHKTYVSPDPNKHQTVSAKTSFAITSKPPQGNKIDPKGKMLALTFDDGPVGLTSSVLDTLRRYGGRGTFFVLGSKVGGYADVINRTIQEGSEIGNHSWGHADLRTLSHAGLEHEIGDTQAAIRQATGGYSPRFMRPPYGGTNAVVIDMIQRYGMTEALWTVDTKDWLNRDTGVVYDRIMGGAYDGAVILLHDIHPNSVEAVNRAIPELRAQGFQLVTLSELYRYRR